MKGLPTEVRFWSKVNRRGPLECWPWLASGTRGYGQFKLNGKMLKAHRFSWFLVNGEVPEGMLVCHRCDNPGCVNPAHLFVGTNQGNTHDRVMKGRSFRPVGERHPLRRRPELAARGESSGSSKLTEREVLSLRGIQGKSHVEIAAMYGVSRSLVGLILQRKVWAWLP